MGKIPIWTSHYSGRSILTLEKKSPNVGPKSILDLCEKNDIKDVFLIENTFIGFLEAYCNAKELGLNLRFGLKLTITDDAMVKEPSLKNESKIIFFIKNAQGYRDLIKIWVWANEKGFYYRPRIDWKHFNQLITQNLIVAFPFYDSFVANNTMTFSDIIPSLPGIKPIFFIEDNDLPFDNIIKVALKNYYQIGGICSFVSVQSIFYESPEDFEAYQTFRCILNKSKLSKPNFDYMSSNTFNFQRWRKENGKED